MFTYLLACAIAILPTQQDALATETLKLQNIKPSRMLRTLRTEKSLNSEGAEKRLIPPGIMSITPSDSTMTLILFGTDKARAELRQVIPLLDVRASEAQIVLRIVREAVVAGMSTGKETVLVHQLKCSNGKPIEVFSKDEDASFRIEFTARINGDKSVSLSGISDLHFDETRRDGLTFSRRIAEKQTSILAGITNSVDNVVQEQLQAGGRATPAGTYYVYYLEAEVVSASVHFGSELKGTGK